MSRDVFVDVHDLSSYVEIRNRLQTRFMHASMARSMEWKGLLTHIKKSDSQSMDGYLREIKLIADSLAAIQCHVSNQDLVQHTLFGLDRDSNSDHIVTTLLHYPFHLSFSELRPKLLHHEQRIKSSKHGLDSSSHHALVVVYSPSLVPLLRILQAPLIEGEIIGIEGVILVMVEIKIIAVLVVTTILIDLVITTTMLIGDVQMV